MILHTRCARRDSRGVERRLFLRFFSFQCSRAFHTFPLGSVAARTSKYCTIILSIYIYKRIRKCRRKHVYPPRRRRRRTEKLHTSLGIRVRRPPVHEFRRRTASPTTERFFLVSFPWSFTTRRDNVSSGKPLTTAANGFFF